MSSFNLEMVAFIREHGTPKLKATDIRTLHRYLDRKDLVKVWVPDEALALGWFPGNGAFYVANLMATSPAALVTLMERFANRFPWITVFEGHRVPCPQRATDPTAEGRQRTYTRRAFERLQRFAQHRANGSLLPASNSLQFAFA